MVFNSVHFAVFFVLVYAAYRLVGCRAQNWLLLAASYYFSQPWVLEGGTRFNYSNPGGVSSTSSYVAVTYGEEKRRIVSLRYGFGTEAYQLIGDSTVLSDFHSDTWTLTWREWLARQRGFQVRLESYRNPTYGRTGLEFSLFQEF